MRSNQAVRYQFSNIQAPFGMGNGLHCIKSLLPRLNLVVKATSCGTYRFGFNGQEKDDEVAGAGNINTALYWEYDTRLGRRWNLDPKPVEGFSQYSCFQNNPIFFIDVNGDIPWPNLIKELGLYKGDYGVFRTKNEAFLTGKVFHQGIDLITKVKGGMSVRAAAHGWVYSAGYENGYGYTVVIKHKNGYYTRYAHLEKPTLKEGQEIGDGEVIGKVNSGRNDANKRELTTCPHLHFEIRIGSEWGKAIDPTTIDDLQYYTELKKITLPVFVVEGEKPKKNDSNGNNSGGSNSGDSTKHDSVLEPPSSSGNSTEEKPSSRDQ